VYSSGGSFSGSAVITNASGANSMFVKNVIVDFGNVGCIVPQGITFSSVAGSLTASSVLHAGPSCATAVIGVYVTDSSGIGRTVTISSDKILMANAGIQVDATTATTVNITSNEVSAAVPIRISGAGGSVSKNTLDATSEAIILNGAPIKVLSNNINLSSGTGVSVGIDAPGSGNTIKGNRVFNYGGLNSTGAGISNTGTGNLVSSNIFRCYITNVSGPAGSGNITLPCPWAPPVCNGATTEQVFSSNMIGCAGNFTFSNRAAACISGWHVCSATEWMANRGSLTPVHIFWTADTLFYNGSGAGNCAVNTSSGFSCAPNSMLVCRQFATTDPEGNSCNWTDCGWISPSPDEMFGGCPGNTAGVLCCQ
jgi:hypothetical protein